jgi:hypothetical protein
VHHLASRRRSRRALLGLLVALFAGLAVHPIVASAATPAPSPAAKPAKPGKGALARAHRGPTARASLCSAPLVGDWHNIDANTNSMTRALVDFTCSDVVLCPVGQPCTGGDSYYSMRVFGKCHPTDCDWGRLRAYDMGDGWIRSIYSFGFKTSHVWLKTYNYYGLTYLRVWVYNDFTAADGRTDYTSDVWMLR